MNPNICTIHDIGEQEGHALFAVELVENETLGQSVKGKPLKTEMLLDLAIQVADGAGGSAASAATIFCERLLRGVLAP